MTKLLCETAADLAGRNIVSDLEIRLLERCDLEAARRLHNDDGTLMWLTDIRHVSEAEQEAWFESVSRSRSSRRYTVLEVSSGKFAGLFRLDQLDLQNGTACVGLDIGAAFRGRGYSKTVFGYFFNYLFNEMGLNRLYLVTIETNTVAINLYRKLGFVEEGRHRQALWRDGARRDLLQFGLLRSEYATLTKVET